MIEERGGNMDEKLKIKSIYAIGGIITGLTLILFFMLTPKIDAVGWVSILFLVLSEIMLFGALIMLTRKKNFFMTIGVVMTLGIYWVVELVLCMMRFIFFHNTVIYLSLQLLLIAVISIMLILFMTIGQRKEAD